MNKMLISYRRDDTLALTGRVFDRLLSHFGHGSVVMDIDSIPVGADFRQYITDAIAECDVLVAVIGDRWLDSGSGKRLDNARDVVRLEIETAMNRGLAVIPVLVADAQMPGEDELPASLKSFAYRNALRIDPGRDFHHHVDRLIQALDRLPSGRKAPVAQDPVSDLEQSQFRQDGSLSNSPMVQLVSGPDKGQTFSLVKDRVLMGRALGSDIPFNTSFLSRHHAQFVRVDDGYSFEDLGSTDGSFVNGVRVGKRVALKDGDIIQVGQVVLIYRGKS
jgi:hypothetical protein